MLWPLEETGKPARWSNLRAIARRSINDAITLIALVKQSTNIKFNQRSRIATFEFNLTISQEI